MGLNLKAFKTMLRNHTELDNTLTKIEDLIEFASSFEDLFETFDKVNVDVFYNVVTGETGQAEKVTKLVRLTNAMKPAESSDFF